MYRKLVASQFSKMFCSATLRRTRSCSAFRNFCSMAQNKPLSATWQKENWSYRTHLQNMPNYAPTLFDFETFGEAVYRENVSYHMKVQEFLQVVRQSHEDSLESDKYHSIIEALDLHASELSVEDIYILLAAVLKFPRLPAKAVGENYRKFWKLLDRRCCELFRSKDLKFQDMFKVCDAWGGLMLTRYCTCSWEFVKKLFRKCDKLNKEEYVRFMFMLIKLRSIHDSINTYELEHSLQKHIAEMTIEELGIACAAFFKTETPIRDSKLVSKLIKKLSDVSHEVEGLFVTAYCKAIRHSSISGLADDVWYMQEKFVPEVDRLQVTPLTHLVLSGTKIPVTNHNLLAKVVAKCENNIHELRLKEMERMALVTGMSNFSCPSFHDKMISELRKPEREAEIQQYARCVPCLLHYMTFQRKYPLDLIEKVLNPEFLKVNYGKNYRMYSRDLLCLDLTMEVEVPEYTGPRLEEKTRTSLMKGATRWIQPENTEVRSLYQNTARSIKNAIETALECPRKVILCNIMPQYNSIEILLCTNKDGEIVEIPPVYLATPEYCLKRIPDFDRHAKRFHVFLLATRPGSALAKSPYSGEFLLKSRQLEAMGYIVHIILAKDWQNLTDDGRREHIKTLISQKSTGKRASNLQK